MKTYYKSSHFTNYKPQVIQAATSSEAAEKYFGRKLQRIKGHYSYPTKANVRRFVGFEHDGEIKRVITVGATYRYD